MLTISAVKNSGDATRYYSHDNYYTQDEGIEHSEWLGKGSDELGLTGTISPEMFADLLNGRVDGEQLGRVTKQGIEHRPGWDLTFSAPKSVSILSEVFDMPEVRQAHQRAVKEALAHVEANYLETRLSAGGQLVRLPAKSAIFATFTHDVSRELDPQLHTHAVLLNATKTPHGWRSIANEKLMDRAAIMEGGMAYRMALARELTGLGFSLKQHRDPRLWEVEGVPDSLMAEFSKRASQIEQYFDSRGLPYDSALAKQVALRTRKRKEPVPREELSRIWKERSEGHALSANIRSRSVDPGASTKAPGKAVRKHAKNAVNHLLENDMGFSDLELQREVMRLGLGHLQFTEVAGEIDRLKQTRWLVEARKHPDRDEKLWTTRQAKASEERLISLLKRGRQSHKALIGSKKAEAFLKKTSLNDQQRQAVLSAVLSQDRYFAIQGDPGVGKTTTLKAYKQLLEKNGYQVKGFAPSYQAVNEMSKSLAVPGMTVDRFLVDTSAQEKGSALVKQVWILDEASMLSTDKVNALMALAEKRDARILLVGDHQQLESVGAGRGFRHLQDAGIEQAVIDKRMRQKTDQLKQVVDHVMAKRYAQAFDLMQEAGQISASIDPWDRQEPLRVLAADYLSRTPEQQAQTLVVAPTNEQRRDINTLIRDGLKAQGRIHGLDSAVSTFTDVRLSEQEKKLASQYKTGQFVRFNYDYRDPKAKVAIDRHEYFQVVGRNTDTNAVALQSVQGKKTLVIDPAKIGGNRPGGLQVFEQETIKLSKGDRLRWLDNSNREGLKRNDEMVVVRATSDWVRLEDGKGKSHKLSLADLKHRHFEYDYSRTAYGVQGKTDREVLAVMESWRKNTVNQRSFMVSVTRASHNLRLYVDSSAKLKKALTERSGDNTEALTRPEFEKEVKRSKERGQERTNRPRIRSLI